MKVKKKDIERFATKYNDLYTIWLYIRLCYICTCCKHSNPRINGLLYIYKAYHIWDPLYLLHYHVYSLRSISEWLNYILGLKV